MKITQISEDVITIDNVTFDHSKIVYGKDWLELAYEALLKQRIAVTNTESILEASKNKLALAQRNFDKLQVLPYDVVVEDLPENVSIKTNLGTEEQPLWLETSVPRDMVSDILRRNPNYLLVETEQLQKY